MYVCVARPYGSWNAFKSDNNTTDILYDLIHNIYTHYIPISRSLWQIAHAHRSGVLVDLLYIGKCVFWTGKEKDDKRIHKTAYNRQPAWNSITVYGQGGHTHRAAGPLSRSSDCDYETHRISIIAIYEKRNHQQAKDLIKLHNIRRRRSPPLFTYVFSFCKRDEWHQKQ